MIQLVVFLNMYLKLLTHFHGQFNIFIIIWRKRANFAENRIDRSQYHRLTKNYVGLLFLLGGVNINDCVNDF